MLQLIQNPFKIQIYFVSEAIYKSILIDTKKALFRAPLPGVIN